MQLIGDLLQLKEGSDNSALPEDVISELKKLIKKGAGDTTQKWANALELTIKAYSVAAVQRPVPSMIKAWQQYEMLIGFAVEQLAKTRGLNGDWRMSSHVFHEALQPTLRFAVTISTPYSSSTLETEARSLDQLLNTIRAKDNGQFDMKVKKSEDNTSAHISFSKFGVNTKQRIEIHQLGASWVDA